MRARELLTRFADPDLSEITAPALAERIGSLVRGGELPAGVELPSERDLAALLGRSRGTVARAYERLRDQGLAYTRHGAGTTIGCCPGPWASSRAAELAPIVTGQGRRYAPVDPGRVIDLRDAVWSTSAASPSAGAHPAATRPAVDTDVPRDRGFAERVASHLDGHGLDTRADQLVLVEGGVRAIDVALATLLRPRDGVLVPALTDPAVLALLTVRGLRPLPLPVDPEARADLPGWLRRIRSRASSVALLAASHGSPAGANLRGDERRLLVEAAHEAGVTLVEDVSHADLWFEQPPPASLAAFEAADGADTITLAATAPLSSDAHSPAWIRAGDGPVTARLRAVVDALDAAPGPRTVDDGLDGFADHADVLRARREQLAANAGAVIRAVTPHVPHVRIARIDGGPYAWVRTGELPGSAVADAAAERGVLVRAGMACAVGSTDAPGIRLALTADTDDLLAGVGVLGEVARELIGP